MKRNWLDRDIICWSGWGTVTAWSLSAFSFFSDVLPGETVEAVIQQLLRKRCKIIFPMSGWWKFLRVDIEALRVGALWVDDRTFCLAMKCIYTLQSFVKFIGRDCFLHMKTTAVEARLPWSLFEVMVTRQIAVIVWMHRLGCLSFFTSGVDHHSNGIIK